MRLLAALALTLFLPLALAGQEICAGVTVVAVGTTPYRVILPGGDTLSQRQQSQLALLDAMQEATARGVEVWVDSRLRVRCPSAPPVVIPPVAVDTVKPPVVVPPIPAEVWADTLLGHYAGDVIVPDGQRWLIGPNVTIAGNLRTDGGLIGMRPGSSLRFIGGDPLQYIGGGMGFTAAFARDVGLWVGGTGILDIQGTAKTSWTREVCHSSWSCGTDEIYISPTAPGVFTPRRFLADDTLPSPFDPRVPGPEVINVTRDITIEGPGHIHISSNQRQRLEFFTLRNMGIINPVCGTVCGRYALHLHMMGEASRGTVIRGVSAVDSKGTVFAMHASHGVTLIDNVCVNGFAECFWGDKGDRTNDTTIEGMASSGTFAPREITGETPRNAAIVLGCGDGNSISNSAVSGVQGSDQYAAGFEWFPCNRDKDGAVWEFSDGLVSHNTEGPAVRFWTNSGQPHVVTGTRTYNSGFAILNGAYSNALEYVDVFSLGGGIFHNTSCNTRNGDSAPGRYLRPEIHALHGPAVLVQGQNLAAECRWILQDCKALVPGPGFPAVQINRTSNGNPWKADFVNCGLRPTDFRCAPDAVPNTSVWIDTDGEFTCQAGRLQLVQDRERPTAF